MHVALLAITAAVALAGPGDASTTERKGANRLENCLVELIDEAKVAAQEAGVMTSVDVREGMRVKAGDVVAQIENSQSQMKKLVAEAERDVAEEEANNDVDVRFAKSAYDVAQAEYEVNLDANKKVPGSKPLILLKQLALQARKAQLMIEQANVKQRTSKLTANAKGTEVKAAENEIQRRKVRAPIDGLVVQVFPHTGEWVAPGDPVMHIVRLDRLRVKGVVNQRDFAAQDLNGRTVTLEVELARGRRERFQGKIVLVDPRVQSQGEFDILADIANRQEDGEWLLRPGLQGDMVIDVARPLASSPRGK